MSDNPGKKKALGRGLSALLDNPEPEVHGREIASDYLSGNIAHLKIEQIEANPFQPRNHFNENELAELALSIRQQGIIQPITVRRLGHEKYQLIAGERRLKAAKLSGLESIPAFVRVANDEQMLEMALVENIQREDLNPLEIALSFNRLIEECKLRQEELCQKVGKDRTTVSNYIRLLKLPSEIQVALRDELITMGHARAIINVENEKDQLLILQTILVKKLSVRQVEDMVRTIQSGKQISPKNPVAALSPRFEQGKASLNSKLQSKVDVRVNRKGAGSITISFNSEEDFNRIVSKFEL
jgi:ParB family chromosome partitioning protein